MKKLIALSLSLLMVLGTTAVAFAQPREMEEPSKGFPAFVQFLLPEDAPALTGDFVVDVQVQRGNKSVATATLTINPFVDSDGETIISERIPNFNFLDGDFVTATTQNPAGYTGSAFFKSAELVGDGFLPIRLSLATDTEVKTPNFSLDNTITYPTTDDSLNLVWPPVNPTDKPVYAKLQTHVGVMNTVIYDSAKGKYGYTIQKYENGTKITSNIFWYPADYSYLIGQNVEGMFKDKNPFVSTGAQCVYMEPDNSGVIAEGVATDLGALDITAKTLKFKGTSYPVALNTDNKIPGRKGYRGGECLMESSASNSATVTGIDPKLLCTIRLIDNNGDGRVDTFVANSFFVGEVMNPNGGITMNILGTGESSLVAAARDVITYDGIKAGDIVAYFPQGSSAPTGNDTVTKLEAKPGKVTEVRDDNQFKVDGTWYTCEPSIQLRAGDYISYIAVGTHIYDAKAIDLPDANPNPNPDPDRDRDRIIDNSSPIVTAPDPDPNPNPIPDASLTVTAPGFTDESGVSTMQGLSFTIKVQGEDKVFGGVSVDGVLLDNSSGDYYTKMGNTITLKPQYLFTLDQGEHTAKIRMSDGATDLIPFTIGEDLLPD